MKFEMLANFNRFPAYTRAMLARGVCICLCIIATMANAHEIRPSYLSLHETRSNQFNVLWKRPITEDVVPDIAPLFSDNCQLTFEPIFQTVSSTILQRGELVCDVNGFEQGRITIRGLSTTLIDVLVRIERLNGDIVQTIIKRDKPYLTIATVKDVSISDYITLGFEHILSGIDHLLFVLALILIVYGMMPLLKTITAFTLAHSITLALATLGVVNVPSKPVEACIALSIVLMAIHALDLRKGNRTLLSDKPWLMAFSFGLLHGLGFAGALSYVGLPENDIPLALLLFNIGIELGQIAFVLLVFVLMWTGKQLIKNHLQPWFTITAYSIGGIGMYFFISNLLR
ncbi:MAG: HupE/UreJ family protein [Paraglaciecola sp.]|uniref:HupE/UreJ family protein n=1 Tax=Paraglaciecola sp. TaxID=1920173 RepID=UPI00329A1214